MAVFYLRYFFLRRSKRGSSLAKAAYNAGVKLEDNKGFSQGSEFTHKGDVLYSEISLPPGTPSWAKIRGELWRRLEAREDRSPCRKNALLTHNFIIALPHELTLEQNIFLARDFVREHFTQKGYVADWSIHNPPPHGDSRNIHLHVMAPLRMIKGESFGNKQRYSKNQLRQQLILWRRSWATYTNLHLKRYGHKVHVDERSLRAQGIKRAPKRKRTRSKIKSLTWRPKPPSPVVTTCKHLYPNGHVAIRMTIQHSALNHIAIKTHAPTAALFRKGWPPEAMRDWTAWGHKNPPRFFSIWPELTPDGYRFGRGMQP